jgi:hypothetical protein
MRCGGIDDPRCLSCNVLSVFTHTHAHPADHFQASVTICDEWRCAYMFRVRTDWVREDLHDEQCDFSRGEGRVREPFR